MFGDPLVRTAASATAEGGQALRGQASSANTKPALFPQPSPRPAIARRQLQPHRAARAPGARAPAPAQSAHLCWVWHHFIPRGTKQREVDLHVQSHHTELRSCLEECLWSVYAHSLLLSFLCKEARFPNRPSKPQAEEWLQPPEPLLQTREVTLV